MGEIKRKIDLANREAVGRLTEARPVWVDVATAAEVVPGMEGRIVLHAGPPTAWERMCCPQKNAVIGAVLFEGWARSASEAEALCASGEVRLDPCHHHQAVGDMCGILSPSMSVFVVENAAAGNRAYALVYEGSGVDQLTWGVVNDEVLANLRWVHSKVARGLGAGLRRAGGRLELKSVISRALLMGDEIHGRNHASSCVFALELAPHLIASEASTAEKVAVAEFLRDSNANGSGFFLQLAMAACKAAADAACGVELSSVVTAIAGNGVEVGIRVSGLGDRWFTGPAGPIEGLHVVPFTVSDGQPDLGDSAIIETCGLGGMAHAASPALALARGGSAREALRLTHEMRQICVSVDHAFALPPLNGEGAPVGIDIRRIIDTGIMPVINTGIAHRDGGRIGIGNSRPPVEAFRSALRAFAEKVREV